MKLQGYAWLSVAAAVVTIALKTLAWQATGSVGLLSDALESLVNLAAALLALAMLRLAAAPGPAKRLSTEAAAALLAHRWPGNVRELRNAMERCQALQRAPPAVSAGFGRQAQQVLVAGTEDRAAQGLGQ